jgi:hypothetical protein
LLLLFFEWGLMFKPKPAWTSILLFRLPVYLRCRAHDSFYWLRWSLENYLPLLASNHDPLDFNLLSSWDFG